MIRNNQHNKKEGSKCCSKHTPSAAHPLLKENSQGSIPLQSKHAMEIYFPDSLSSRVYGLPFPSTIVIEPSLPQNLH